MDPTDDPAVLDLALRMHAEFQRWWSAEGRLYGTPGIYADAVGWDDLAPETRAGSLHLAAWLLAESRAGRLT
jgi:hypothetical protein